MSRLQGAGHSAEAIPGEVALPRPSGDAQSLRAAAGSLDRTAARAEATSTVRGTLAVRLEAVWTGAAATAARSEAGELGRRSRRVVDGLSATARSLRTYAAALELATARVRSLQRQWDELDADRARAGLRLAAVPDPTGAVGALGLERARAEQEAGRVRLSRSYESVLAELRTSARRCAALVAGVTAETYPTGAAPTGAGVRSAVTGGLWFADGVVAARASREAALSDGTLIRQAVAASATSGVPVDDPQVAQLAARVGARAHDPVYAQALLSELGADGLAQVLMAAGVTQSRSGAHVDAVRQLLGASGSLLLTATSGSAPVGTDPRTRAQLASGGALVSDDVVAGLGQVRQGADGGRATGAWLLGQLLSGARAAGDGRRLPARLARRAAAAAATAEIAETRDADGRLQHGTTLRPYGNELFPSWFDDASRTGDALHVLLDHVGDDPDEQAALLAEPLPDSAVAAGALANSRGDRLTIGEHLVRRWVTVEATGTASHPDLHLATDADLVRLLPSIASDATAGAAQTRSRVMLELSRTSAHAMRDASTTQIYTHATAPLEDEVADWLSAMRENVDAALSQPDSADIGAVPYYAATSHGVQPWLESAELTGVVGALAADTGIGLRAKDPGAAYERLVDKELQATRASVAAGGDGRRDVTRLGFFDQAASAELVALAHRQDDLNRSALQGLAEAGHVIATIRSGDVAGLALTVQTYLDGGTTRTAADDLVISLVRSDVELAQTERNDSRRAELVARLAAITGSSSDVRPSLVAGARRGPTLPTAEQLRQVRRDEQQAAWVAFRDETLQRISDKAEERLDEPSRPSTQPHAAGAQSDVDTTLAELPRGQQRHVRLVHSEHELHELLGRLTESAQSVTPPRNYRGRTWEREDGLRVGVRTSTKFGASIDIWFPNGDYKKVHIDAVAKP